MNLSRRSVAAASSMGPALFGAWTLCVQVAALLRADFATLEALFPFVVLGAAALLLIAARQGSHQPLQTDYCARATVGGSCVRVPEWLWLAAPAFLAGFYWATGAEWLFWVMSLAYLLAASCACSFDPSPGPLPDSKIAGWEVMSLLGLCAVAVLLGLGAHRPDADDAFFVSLASSAIDYPKAPLFGFDSLYKSGLPLVEQHLHFGQAHEYLIAVLAALTRVPVRVLYYVMLPALWLAMLILAHWNLLRRWLPVGPAMIGLTALIALLAVWGDGHRTYGSFAFVRIFQGKSVFVIVAVPLIVHAAIEYLDRPSWRSWLLLMLQQCAAMGLTVTAQVMAPLVSALVLLSGLTLSGARWRTVAKGLLASVPAVPAVVATLSLLRQYRVYAPEAEVLLGYPIVLGSSRASLVLLGLLLVPALARMAGLREALWLGRYVLLSSALLLCPAVPELLGVHLSAALSWRIFWCWPVPLLLSVTVGAASCRALPRPWLRGAALGAAMLVFAVIGPSAVSASNWAWANVGAFNVPADYAVAERLMTLAPSQGPALVPEGLAVSLCGFQHAPPLVAVRRMYLEKLRGVIPEQDWTARMDLLAYIGGAEERRPVDWVLSEIDRRGISMIAVRTTHPDAASLLRALAERHFEIQRDAGYVLAVRSVPEK